MAARVEPQVMRTGPNGSTKIPVAMKTIPPHVPDNANADDNDGRTTLPAIGGTTSKNTASNNNNNNNNNSNGHNARRKTSNANGNGNGAGGTTTASSKSTGQQADSTKPRESNSRGSNKSNGSGKGNAGSGTSRKDSVGNTVLTAGATVSGSGNGGGNGTGQTSTTSNKNDRKNSNNGQTATNSGANKISDSSGNSPNTTARTSNDSDGRKRSKENGHSSGSSGSSGKDINGKSSSNGNQTAATKTANSSNSTSKGSPRDSSNNGRPNKRKTSDDNNGRTGKDSGTTNTTDTSGANTTTKNTANTNSSSTRKDSTTTAPTGTGREVTSRKTSNGTSNNSGSSTKDNGTTTATETSGGTFLTETDFSTSSNGNNNSGSKPSPTSVPSKGSTSGDNGPTMKKRNKLKRLNLAASAPEHPLYPNGPPPEDRLVGANTARSTSLATTRTQDGAKNSMMSVQVRAGLQRVYLEGMEYMKARIQDVRDDITRIQCDYHHALQPDEDQFLDYLKACDQHFLRANTELRKRDVKLEVIDSETRLVALLNQIREDDDVDPECVAGLTDYWENIKTTVESLRAALSKFQTTVLNRLKLNYISYHTTDTHLDVCAEYTEDISTHMTDMERLLSNAHILLKSFSSGIHQDLFDSSRFIELVLVSCDLKAFPVLRLVADVSLKVDKMCEIALQWLARDEKFMHEIHDYIREARHAARKREEDLKSQKEKQKKYEKSMKAANILLQNNKEKLNKIETELKVLEEQLDTSENEKKCRYDELHQKESMVDFLKLTLSQTKRNYSLQSKRTKLLRQVDDLKELLEAMERELTAIQAEIQVKAEEKVRLSEKVENGERSYETLRGDMDRFSNSLERLETEVTSLSGQILQLEIIHNLKTSPEKVEEIYDRPSTVKLAPSLKEKIKERKRKIHLKAK